MSVKIEFILAEVLEGKTEKKKIEYILNSVKKDKILVVEGALNPFEEQSLLEKTMEAIDDKFTGIEVSTIGDESDDLKSRILRLLGGKAAGLTVIGPAKLVKQIKKDPDKLRLYAEI